MQQTSKLKGSSNPGCGRWTHQHPSPPALQTDPPKRSAEPLAASSQTYRPDETACRQGTLLPTGHSQFLLQCLLGLTTINMRTTLQFLAVLTIAALLAPTARWASLRVQAQACACPPTVCACSGHQHTSGHASSCSMKDGGRCGIGSQDAYLSAALTTLTYMPTEFRWANPPAPWSINHAASGISLLPSHARIPDQPPRPTP